MKPKYSLDEISQVIDLSEILGRQPSEVELKQFSDDAIELIIERTQSGEDINGRRFKEYSKEYAELKGTSRSSVDLTLMGDMLLGIQAEQDRGRIRLFMEPDQVPKAYNHNVGDTLPKRTFFGLTDSEIETLAGSLGVANIAETREDFDIASLLQNIGFAIDEN
jgi:hypothetical protein